MVHVVLTLVIMMSVLLVHNPKPLSPFGGSWVMIIIIISGVISLLSLVRVIARVTLLILPLVTT